LHSALFDNRWSGKKGSTSNTSIIVVRRRPARHGAMGRGSRDSRCSAHPLLRRAGGAPQHRGYSSMVRASGCRPEGCGFELRWPRSRNRFVVLRRARGVGSPRAGGVASNRSSCTSTDTHAVVAQRTRAPGFEPGGREFESLRRHFQNSRKSRTRGWCKRIGTRGCDPLRTGSSPVPLIVRRPFVLHELEVTSPLQS
jgi:hypothetical protein